MSLDITLVQVQPTEVFSSNITHNLTNMAAEARIYKHLWFPEELGITKARQLIEPLMTAVAVMKLDPKKFKAFNPPNGWGSYENFVPWLEELLRACEAHPDAEIQVSR